MPRLYIPENLAVDQPIILPKEASRHLLGALRARVNDPVTLFNGLGGEYYGSLVEISKNQAVVKLVQYEKVDRESPLAIHLLQSISRSNRMDYVIQKATELGVVSITPLFTENTSVKLSSDRLRQKFRHWQSIVISSCEQSGRCFVPNIKLARTLTDYLAHHEGIGFICDPRSRKQVNKYSDLHGYVSLLIGPEGGFSDHEVLRAIKAGFQSLSLGPRILRTETAPVVAMSLLQSKGGDF